MSQDAPFFVEKLQVRLLPCVVAFVNGVAADRIVGFDQLGATDDFPTEQVHGAVCLAAPVPFRLLPLLLLLLLLLLPPPAGGAAAGVAAAASTAVAALLRAPVLLKAGSELATVAPWSSHRAAPR